MPGLLIALSVRFWTLRSELAYEWLGDSSALLIFAFVVRFGSLALGVCLVAVIAVPKQLHEAAVTLGASQRRRFRKIDLPIMAPSLLAGSGLVLLSVLKELPISLLVSPLGFTNLTSRIFMSFEDAFVAEAGIMAVVLVSISFALTWFLVLSNAEHR
jgi:iron(III) transport system permease protein